jgi:hypothetical protein
MDMAVKTVEKMRPTLVAEGVFTATATADEPSLRTFWNVRGTPEYQRPLTELEPLADLRLHR